MNAARIAWPMCLCLLAVTAAVPEARAGQPVRVGVYQNPPKVFTNESGRAEGIFIDVLEAIAADEGWSIEYVPGTWAEGLDRLAASEIDLMPDVANTQARAANFAFHRDPVLSDWFQIYARRGSGIRSVLDLDGKRVALLERSIQQEAFGQASVGFGLEVDLVPYSEYALAFAAVAQGDADAVIANRFYGAAHAREYNVEDTAIIFSPTRLFFAAPAQGRSALLDAIDRHLEDFKKDSGSIYYQSLRHWTSEELGFQLPWWFKGAGAAALLLLLFSFLWSITLRRQVEARTRDLALRNDQLRFMYKQMELGETALRESETKFRTLFETAKDAILLMRQDRFVDCNEWSLSMFGCTREQILGALLYDFSPVMQPDGRSSQEVAREMINRAMVEGPQFFEWEHRRRDGSPFMAEVSLNRLELGGEPLLQAIVRDITGRKETERALYESERKYRELVEHVNCIILRWAHDGRITFLNKFGLDFFGYAPEEIIGQSVMGTIVPETASSGEDLRQLMAKICADPVAFEQNVNENMRRNGERVWIAWTNKIVWSAQEQVSEILSVGTDITARRSAEEALRRSEEQFRLIMENLADLVAVLDLDGRRLYNSPSYGGILGDPDRLRGSSSFEEVHPDDVARVQQAFQETVCTGSGHRLEYRLLDQNGEPRHIESQGSVIRDGLGRVTQVLVVSRDVTERRKAEEAIRELNAGLERRVAERTAELAVARDRAEAADRVKSAFLATMSHELRTPLNSIIGFTGILLQELPGPLNEEQHKQLEIVRKSARHLLTLINDVLDISKIEAGQLEVRCESFDVRAAIEKVAGIVRPLAEKKGLALRLEIAPDVDSLVADNRRVEQVLLNLMNNAIKFTDRGEVILSATRVNAPRPAISLRVADTGIGIKPDDLRTLFQPFRQVESGLTRNYEGTGLGLAICRRLAELMGGEIHAESEWGNGSVFTFTLPLEGPTSR